MATIDLTDPVNTISLDSFTKSCPPGWDPAVAHRYPSRQFLQLPRLWNLQTDMETTKMGPAICGRLRGTAFQYAMQLSQTRLNMTTGALELMPAPELFAEAACDEWTHPQDGTVFPAMGSGASFLIESLKQEFSGNEQDLQWQALNAVLELFREHSAIADNHAVLDLTWTGGLYMNDVGRSFFLLRSAQLTERQLNYIIACIDGDLSRYSDILQLVSQMLCNQRRAQAATVPAMAG